MGVRLAGFWAYLEGSIRCSDSRWTRSNLDTRRSKLITMARLSVSRHLFGDVKLPSISNTRPDCFELVRNRSQAGVGIQKMDRVELSSFQFLDAFSKLRQVGWAFGWIRP